MFEFLFKYPPTVFAKGNFVLLGQWPVWTLIGLLIAAAVARTFHSETQVLSALV